MGIFDTVVDGATQIAEYGVSGAQRLQDIVGPVERFGIQTLGLPSAKNLDDRELVWLLGLAAFDSYTLNGECRGKLKVTFRQLQNLKDANMLNDIQFGVYEVKKGRHRGKKILAYRGTDVENEVSGVMTLLQDASLCLPNVRYLGQPIKEAISCAVKNAQLHRPDYICGHSLGGLLAECVCSETGLPGASFNAPGPWATTPENNLLSGTEYDGVQFEVHLTKNDPVSLYGGYLGPECSHVGHPVWHPGVGLKKDDLIANHKMELMLNDLEKR